MKVPRNRTRASHARHLALLSAALLLGACGSDTSDGRGNDDGGTGVTVNPCYPGDRKPCTCTGGASGTKECTQEGIFLACVCGGQGSQPDAGGATVADGGGPSSADLGTTGNPPAPDSRIQTPATCEDGEAIELPAETHLERHGDIVMVERHYADGSPTVSEARATFLDYSQFTGSTKPGDAIGVNCKGSIGPTEIPSAKHCEYTKKSCSSASECSGAACRATDRLDVASVSISGAESGSISLTEHDGVWKKDGLAKVFGSQTLGVNVGPGKNLNLAHPYAPGLDFFVFFAQWPPKLVQMISPSLSGTTTIGGDTLELRWRKKKYEEKRNESNLIYIDLVGQQTKKGSPQNSREIRLSCVVVDDGCKTISTEAIDWLLQSDAQWSAPSTINIAMRHRYKHVMGQNLTGIDKTSAWNTFWAELHGTLKVQR